ncbi:hypothetical protein [Pseudomonas massiliensis]|uniref:hypothetical protein n=1 Tax=Pseudomonas massiliensis TaxID=522492 RepID=UPI0006933533|nr:hypothetical protein [Pseudomonas massiliensis]
MSISHRSINNPLALIAVLAATTEASALASLPLLDPKNQSVFVWFLVGFPPFLTALFFITLNFNRQAFSVQKGRERRCRPARQTLSQATRVDAGTPAPKPEEQLAASPDPCAMLSRATALGAHCHVLDYPPAQGAGRFEDQIQAWAEHTRTLCHSEGGPATHVLLVRRKT